MQKVYNRLPTELSYLNFHPLEGLSLPLLKLKVSENWSYLLYLRTKHLQIFIFEHSFISQWLWFDQLIKEKKNL